MLKVFRDNLKNLAWILWVIIALFVLALAADFGARAGGRGSETAVARVGGETISRQEFQRAYQNMTNVYRQIYGDQLSPDIEKQMYRQTLTPDGGPEDPDARGPEARPDGQRRRAARPDPLLPDLQGRAGALRRRGGLRPGDPGGAPHRRVADFEKELRDELLVKKFTDAIAANLYVSEDEIQRAYRDQVERAKIRYVELPRSRFAQQVARDAGRGRGATTRPTSRSSSSPSSATWPTCWSTAPTPARSRPRSRCPTRISAAITTPTRPSSPRRSRSGPATSW